MGARNFRICFKAADFSDSVVRSLQIQPKGIGMIVSVNPSEHFDTVRVSNALLDLTIERQLRERIGARPDLAPSENFIEHVQSLQIATHQPLSARQLLLRGIELPSSDQLIEELSVLATDLERQALESSVEYAIRAAQICCQAADGIYQQIRLTRDLSSVGSKSVLRVLESWKSDLYRSALLAGATPEALLNARTERLFELAKADPQILVSKSLPQISCGEALVLCQALSNQGINIPPWRIYRVVDKWQGIDLDGVPFARSAVRQRIRELAGEVDETTPEGFRKVLPRLSALNVKFRTPPSTLPNLVKCIDQWYGATCIAIEDVVSHHPDFSRIAALGFSSSDCPELPQYYWITKSGEPSSKALADIHKAYEVLAQELGVTLPYSSDGFATIHAKFHKRRLDRMPISYWGRTATAAINEAFNFSATAALQYLFSAKPHLFIGQANQKIAPTYKRVPSGTWQTAGIVSENSIAAVSKMFAELAQRAGVTLCSRQDLNKLLPLLIRDKLRLDTHPAIAQGREALRRGFLWDKDKAFDAAAKLLDLAD